MLTIAVSGNGNTDGASLQAAGGPGDPSMPGFVNVGLSPTQGASVTYLGNGWIITARHVTISDTFNTVYFGGIGYTVENPLSPFLLFNPDNSNADLKLYHLTTTPNLPSLIPLIDNTSPGGRVIMVGNGVTAGAQHFWNVNKSGATWQWTDGSQPAHPGPNDYSGFDLIATHVIRWGENDVFGTNILVNTGVGITNSFSTKFDNLAYTQTAGLASEAQATTGDSGGAVFALVGGQWELSGIMLAISGPLNNQPLSTALFGDQSYIADLSTYRSQILATITPSVVASRLLFYNQSAYDGNTAGVDPLDDSAISNKLAYLPGDAASTNAATAFTHESNYTKGINGLMIDLSGGGAHSAITASDFVFRVGVDDGSGHIVFAPATAGQLPTTVSTRAGAGAAGSDRVELIWANNSLTNVWLEVQVKEDANTGLAQNANDPAGIGDIFSFANKAGDTGNDNGGSYITNSTDLNRIRSNAGNGLPVDNTFDVNKDGIVNSIDGNAARSNAGNMAWFSVAVGVPFAPGAAPLAPSAAPRGAPSATPAAATTGIGGGSASAADAALASSLSSSSSSPTEPAWPASWRQNGKGNNDLIAQLPERLARDNIPLHWQLLLTADQAADVLKPDDRLLDSLLADWGLE